MWTDYSLGLWHNRHTRYPVVFTAPMSCILCLPSQRLTPSFCWSISLQFLRKRCEGWRYIKVKERVSCPLCPSPSERRNGVFREVNLTIQETVTLVWEQSQLDGSCWICEESSQGCDGPGTSTWELTLRSQTGYRKLGPQGLLSWYPRKVGYEWNGMLLGYYPFIRLWVNCGRTASSRSRSLASLVPLERKAGADPSALLHAYTKSLLSLKSYLWSTSTSDFLPHGMCFVHFTS